MSKWEYDKEVKWHTLSVPGDVDAFVFVYKSEGGDYVVSAMREGDAAGGEVEYLPTLPEAKKFAESLIKNGTWGDYALSA